MVDPIGTRPISSSGPRGIMRAEIPARIGAPATDASAAPSPVASVAATTLAQSLSEAPPVDLDRVATIRRAIEEGRFPLSPSTIADSLIALKLDWISREPS